MLHPREAAQILSDLQRVPPSRFERLQEEQREAALRITDGTEAVQIMKDLQREEKAEKKTNENSSNLATSKAEKGIKAVKASSESPRSEKGEKDTKQKKDKGEQVKKGAKGAKGGKKEKIQEIRTDFYSRQLKRVDGLEENEVTALRLASRDSAPLQFWLRAGQKGGEQGADDGGGGGKDGLQLTPQERLIGTLFGAFAARPESAKR